MVHDEIPSPVVSWSKPLIVSLFLTIHSQLLWSPLQSVWISVDTQQGYRRNVRGLQRRLDGCAIPDNHDGEMVKIDILLCSAHNIIFGDRRYVFGVLLVEIIRKTQHVNPCDRPVDCADRCELIW